MSGHHTHPVASCSACAEVIRETDLLRISATSKGFTRLQTSALAAWVCLTVGTVAASDSWSSPTTWGGAVPQGGDVVTIPSGRDVLLDVDPPPLRGLIIKGHLTFDQRDLQLASRWILIDGGTLSIGSEQAPHTNSVLITLTGTDEAENIAGDGMRSMGTKFIGVMNGGRLELHGARARATNWTQLDGTAPAGSTRLRPAAPVEWEAGDQIVIAPSGFDPMEAEEITVTSVADGVVHFTPPLQHDHWGEIQVVGGHQIDERAEVACLTRNIVIQGDEASAQSDFGGHLMFAPGTTVHIEGVEFNRMGQKGHAGRYPVHWHLAGDHQGDYARGNSIHHSYHRAIVVHGTSNVLVANNVSFDVWSHAFVPAENGSETGNRFVHNLAVLTRQLALGDYAFPATVASASLQSEGRPGAFWLKSPDHFLTGNHAAGVVNGMGFLYDGPGPAKEWTGSFSNNTAHSCSAPPGTPASHYPSLTKGYGLFMENESQPAEIVFQHFTAYKNTLSGVWLEARGHRLQDAVLADNGTGAMLFQSTLEDAVIVGQSANTLGQRETGSLEGGVYLLADDGLKAPQLRDIDFINQAGAGIVVPGTRLHPLSMLSQLHFTNTLPCRIDLPAELIGGFTDADGSVRGDGIPVYIHGHDALATTPESVFDENINAWVTPLNQLEYLSLTAPGSQADGLGFTLLVGDTQMGELPATGYGDRARTVSGYVEKDRAYSMLRFDPLPAGVRICGSGGTAGFVELQVPFRGAAYVYDETATGSETGVPDFTRPIPFTDSLAQFTSSTQTVWFDEPATETLHLRIRTGQAFFLFDQPMGDGAASPALALWRVLEFGSQIARNPAAETIWGDPADPDGDGFSNLMEFFLASDPLLAGHPLVFDPPLRRLSFTRNPAASNLTFVVSYSHNLTNWYTDTDTRETQLPDGMIQMDATAPGPELDRLFMGLKVRRAP